MVAVIENAVLTLVILQDLILGKNEPAVRRMAHFSRG